MIQTIIVYRARYIRDACLFILMRASGLKIIFLSLALTKRAERSSLSKKKNLAFCGVGHQPW